MPTCDIIIPAYNNADVLPLTLAALQEQGVPAGWEVGVIVADDGSTDSTPAVISSMRRPLAARGLRLTCLRDVHAGAARARNRALAMSKADIVFFLGADIILRPSSLAAHLQFHQHSRSAAAALGMVRWDPRLLPTPLMEWMVHSGPQNDFDSLLGTPTANPTHFFFGSHLSIPRKFLPRGGFPIDYESYGWEDLDLGRQLAKEGMRLAVLHAAVGLHRHAYSAADVYRRQRSVGRGVGIYAQRYPKAQILPPVTLRRWLKIRAYQLSGARLVLRLSMRILAPRYSLPRLFLLITAAEYWLGVLEFQAKYRGKR